ncbi:hypothetical protein CAPTEDRAFT_202489 [Capitella teleta]|uniref:Uncharacterized protein n=1 Tax=Capitella teleta TaxID=283909 RepID=R7T591_CAPTE|nr:hypothetical protein CAPTEDRAFT_202489 [Capitella teleta]|eukprot:ELT88479.1 hypothetical protein CAPTEDRAFT_202489 [Capitella teleta]
MANIEALIFFGSMMIIKWTQDQGIPESHAKDYGYTFSYTDESGDVLFGPSIAHDPQTETQNLTVPDYSKFNVYIRPYRLVDDCGTKVISSMEEPLNKLNPIALLVVIICGVRLYAVSVSVRLKIENLWLYTWADFLYRSLFSGGANVDNANQWIVHWNPVVSKLNEMRPDPPACIAHTLNNILSIFVSGDLRSPLMMERALREVGLKYNLGIGNN